MLEKVNNIAEKQKTVFISEYSFLNVHERGLEPPRHHFRNVFRIVFFDSLHKAY